MDTLEVALQHVLLVSTTLLQENLGKDEEDEAAPVLSPRLQVGVLLLSLPDAQHRHVGDPTLLQGPAEVTEAPSGYLCGFNAAAFVFGGCLVFCYSNDRLETVGGFEVMFKSLTGGRPNSKQQTRLFLKRFFQTESR